MQETWVRSLGWQNPLEKGIATYPSIPRTSPWGRKEADTTERLSLHFHILKVCELQPGGARALDRPACNSLAVSGPSGRHTSVLLRYSHLSHLLLDHPPTSVSHETDVSVQWDAVWGWRSSCGSVHSSLHHLALPLTPPSTRTALPPTLSISPQPPPPGVWWEQLTQPKGWQTLSRASAPGCRRLPVQVATAETRPRVLTICCFFWTPDEV